MKAKIILIACVLGAIGLFAADVYCLNNSRFFWSLIVTLMLLVPLYFVYSIFALGKYRQSAAYKSGHVHTAANTKTQYSAKNDYGKVLEFPVDKQKTKKKK